MRDERPRRRSSRNGVHHRRFDFHVSPRVEKSPQLGDNLRAPHENLAHSLVHDQIEIPPPVAHLYIRQPVPFFRQRQQSLAQHLEPIYLYRQLVRLGAEKMPGDADDVSQIQQLKQLKRLLPHHIQPDVNLQPPAIPAQVGECRLAVRPQRYDAPCHAHRRRRRGQFLRRFTRKFLGGPPRCMRPVKLVRMCRVTQGFDFG